MGQSFALAVSALVVAAGCAVGPRPAHSLSVLNGTTLAVTLAVNGQTVAVFPPGESRPAIEFSALPARPWSVEARSPSGRVLATMDVNPGDGIPDPAGAMTVPFGRADLSCGRLEMWVGDSPHTGPPDATSSLAPGDCAP